MLYEESLLKNNKEEVKVIKVNKKEIMERWKEYFSELLNEQSLKNFHSSLR